MFPSGCAPPRALPSARTASLVDARVRHCPAQIVERRVLELFQHVELQDRVGKAAAEAEAQFRAETDGLLDA